MKIHQLVTLGSVIVALASLSLWASEKHAGHKTPQHNTQQHSETPSHNNSTPNSLPQEGGQAAFAALIEIVGLLEQNEKTDWQSVDVDGLHSHLLDMDRLMRDTRATSSTTDNNQVKYEVRGTSESIASIHRMASAHSRFIQQSRGWTIETQNHADGTTIVISVDDSNSVAQLKALGFYGFMALDSHHQAHHMQMANGKSH